MRHEVLVTGMAWSTALGNEVDDVWQQVLAGRTGLSQVHADVPVRNALAAPVPLMPDRGPAERLRGLASDTAARAIADAGLDGAAGAHFVVGTSYGSDIDEGPEGDLGSWAAVVARTVGCELPPITLSTACSSGADAICLGAELVAQGLTERAVCGGADVLSAAKRLGHSTLGTMSPTRLRSFDTRCDGTLLGEGAGFLVLEEAGSARARGARVHARFRAGAAANDAHSLTAPDPDGHGLELAVTRCLSAAGVTAGQVAVISTHGSGTRTNDVAEAKALSRLFRCTATGTRPVLFATKGAFGHTLGATGAMEAIAVIAALRSCAVPAVPGLQVPLDEMSLRLPVQVPASVDGTIGASVTLGFGGFITCLLFDLDGSAA